MRWAGRVGIAGLIVMLAGSAGAQAPTCEDQRQVVQLLAEQYDLSRRRTELEAAQAIARLLKRVGELEAQLATATSARGQTGATPGGKP